METTLKLILSIVIFSSSFSFPQEINQRSLNEILPGINKSEYSVDLVEEVWIRQYKNMGDSWNFATDIAIDAAGDIYVTGFSYDTTYYNYSTIKYNSSGDTIWVARYYESGNYWNNLHLLAVDALGNVYVAGSGFTDSSTTFHFKTIKYNNSGIKLWESLYNEPSGGYSDARDLAIDEYGNVYVTGSSQGSGTSVDYATVKYNNSGIEEWVARYNGPGNSSDFAQALSVDGSGNVYVTGSSGSDYATIKYNSSGTEQWVARYPGDAYSIAVDESGNVYVTGSSFGSGTFLDYATIKYNSSGVEQWVSRYDGPGNDLDIATKIAVHPTGNIYVTGQSAGSGTSWDYATVKYNSFGVEQWVARYNGPGSNEDIPNDLLVDELGDVYVTGSSWNGSTLSSSDYATIKYDSSGVEKWIVRYNGSDNGADHANALAIDEAGHVYVTGFSRVSTSTYAYTTIKYSQSVTSVDDPNTNLPERFILTQNYPNPFNPSTVISYQLPLSGSVTLKVYDLLGREVATLVNEEKPAGSYEVEFNAAGLSSGIYFYTISAGNFIETKKMVLMR